MLESAVVRSSVERNSYDYLNMIENVQGLHLCSGYSLKTMQGDKNTGGQEALPNHFITAYRSGTVELNFDYYFWDLIRKGNSDCVCKTLSV
jgi:hypothetical protein